jgi:hypothetical protein
MHHGFICLALGLGSLIAVSRQELPQREQSI